MQTSIKRVEFSLFSKDNLNYINTYTKTVDIVYRRAFTGYSNSEYPLLFTAEQRVALALEKL